ncbi:MAG: cytochrome C [Campylobacterota bacterium]|nr:cytochrome C [Campylobacterota bacterium]
MNKLLKLAFVGAIALGLSTTAASADVKKGQKLYSKKLKKACGVTGAKMAGKHTQGEWSEINSAGKMADEIKALCPTVKDKSLKEKYLPHYFDFFHEYASDSGNVPSC